MSCLHWQVYLLESNTRATIRKLNPTDSPAEVEARVTQQMRELAVL